MIPPEPGPDPPIPVTPEYTYSSSSSISLGDSVTGTLYKDIQYEGSPCELTTQVEGSTVLRHYTDIILYDVDGTHYCYFTRGTNTIYGILGNNAEIGLTVVIYKYENGGFSPAGWNGYLQSSTPLDYFENIRTRNFTLVQRS